MRRRSDFVWLAAIVLLVAGAVWVIRTPRYPVRLGLDLQGGLQVLLEADVPAEEVVTADAMNTARQIIDRRVNAIGVAEPLVQVEGDRRILVELPGIATGHVHSHVAQRRPIALRIGAGQRRHRTANL